ncbi:MAG: hypothetical protein M3N93_01995 [Acidobacteriota bacterium]|nr:hypothetical protein [Acidobacteriota bacterium]
MQGRTVAKYRIETQITGVFTPKPTLFLSGHKIHLAYNGSDKYLGTDLLELEKKLVVQFVGPGLSGQQWQIDLTIGQQAVDGSFPPSSAGNWNQKGEVPAGGSSGFYGEVSVPVSKKNA